MRLMSDPPHLYLENNAMRTLSLPTSPLRALARVAMLAISLFLALSASRSHAVIPASERAVLQALYTSAGGASWTNNTGWNGAVGTECAWYGITCSAGDVNVIRINLAGNNLVGNLPTTLNQLSALQLFDVGFNQLTGAIPPLTGLTALQSFNLRFNQLNGAIPALTGLSALSIFTVDNNQLTGAIPALIGLSALDFFYAYNNQLTGAIPALTGLSSLRFFRVHSNQLTGAIPTLTALSALSVFQANDNQLTGAIPALNGSSDLRAFTVENNQLTGAIPALTGLGALSTFRVDNNQLTGAVPALTGLSALSVFRVDNNQFTGAIPAVPAPINVLQTGLPWVALCPNQLIPSVDPAWDTATGVAPWSTGCIGALPSQTLSFGAAPILTVGGMGTVTATAAPLPNSANPVVYASLTPLVCSVNAASGLVTVQPSAAVGNTCTITADKAGDATANSAPQVQLSIPIAPICRLDINGDGARNADVDGLLTHRYLLGLRGNALIEGLTPLAGTRNTSEAIETFLAAQDFNVSGLATPALATRDGLAILRYLQAQPATPMIAGTGIAPANATAVQNRVAGWCP
jgi:hypothetical protein